MTPERRVLADPAEVARTAADWFAGTVRAAVERSGRATVALAGGSTPRSLYQALVAGHRTSVPWDRVHVFWGDERCVPPDHPDSNFALAARTLLAGIDIPTANVHRMPAEVQPVEEAAGRYEQVLKGYFSRADSGASFDLVLLGVGEDGHTASLFPGLEALAETARWVVPVFAPPANRPRLRLTLTLPLLNRSLRIAFLAVGSAKRDIIRGILGTPPDNQYPAARVNAREAQVWFIDRAASWESDLATAR